MRIEVDIDAVVLQFILKRYPQASAQSINLFKDRVGRALEHRIKSAPHNESPHVTGNLRRQTLYREGSGLVQSWAEYAKYVHGAPFYKFKSTSRRKVTPFFTYAINNKKAFINQEAKDILTRVLK